MSKKLFALFALVLMLGVTGVAMAETPTVAADQDVAAVLGLDQESCDAPAVEAAPAADLDLANDLLVEMNDTEPCNQKVCGHGQFCCNFSCSICAPDGGFCTQQVCE